MLHFDVDFYILVAGFLIATAAGAVVVALVLKAAGVSHSVGAPAVYIGLIERAISFVFVLRGDFIALSVLFGVKAIVPLRADDPAEKRDAIVLGTIASIGWSLFCAIATQYVLGR